MSTPDVTFVTTGHDVADARLHRLAGALMAAGLTVDIIGLGEASTGPVGSRTTTTARPGLVGRAISAVRSPARARGKVLISLDPDSAVGCAIIATCRRRKFVSDIHEDYSKLLLDRAWAHGLAGALGRAVIAVANLANRAADLVVVADEQIATRADRIVVKNLPVIEDLPPVGPPVGAPRAIYIGDIRRSRGLATMLEAIELAPDWSLDLVGPVAPSDTDYVEQWRRGHPDAAARVRWHGRQPPREAWQVAAGAWAGLALLEPTRAFTEAMPTKVYEYLSCGLPVITSSLPRPATLVASLQAGRIADTAPAVAAILRDWSADPASHDDVRRHAELWAPHERSPYAEFAAAVTTLARGTQ